MKSTIILTVKCLVLSGLIIAGCTIAETIDFNFDFSGTRTVEFQYRTVSEDGTASYKDKEMPHGLRYIDSISQWVSNVTNFKIDTSDQEIAKLSYDFTKAGLKIKDQKRYNSFMNKMPEEFRWYFKEQPNTFKPINENQVLWNAVKSNVESVEFDTMKELVDYHKGVSSLTKLNFQRRIKNIQPNLEDIVISPDRKSLSAEVKLDDVFGLKRANKVVITFE